MQSYTIVKEKEVKQNQNNISHYEKSHFLVLNSFKRYCIMDLKKVLSMDRRLIYVEKVLYGIKNQFKRIRDLFIACINEHSSSTLKSEKHLLIP